MADIVLIHGAWAGSWVWDSLLEGLRSAGHRPHAIDLPGNGHDATPLAKVSLQRYVEHVGALIETLPGPIQLVAHSGGGVTATAVAEAYAERIAGVAYVAGMMLPSGMNFGELCAELARDFPEVSGIGPYLEAAPGGSRVPSDAACAVFFHDAPAQAAIAAARRLTVQPDGGRDIAAHWSAERFGRLPRLYIEAAQDRSVLPLVQQRMQQLVPGAERVLLDCGHAPQLAMPGALLAALVDFFARHPHPVH
ncbi:alpha/beta fold hydrolase [Stutzerimonas chloritidismutans]